MKPQKKLRTKAGWTTDDKTLKKKTKKQQVIKGKIKNAQNLNKKNTPIFIWKKIPIINVSASICIRNHSHMWIKINLAFMGEEIDVIFAGC